MKEIEVNLNINTEKLELKIKAFNKYSEMFLKELKIIDSIDKDDFEKMLDEYKKDWFQNFVIKKGEC